MPTLPWQLLQIADSGFPVGGFAHSGGLESLMHNGGLSASGELDAYLAELAWQCGRGILPFVTAAHAAPERVASLDAHLESVLVNHVANRASRAQGRAWLATAVKVFPGAALAELDRRARRPGVNRHLAPVFGAVARALDAPREHAQQIFLYLTARGALSSAVRLGLVGPLEAQRIQYDCAGLLDRVLAACADLAPEHVAQTSPVLDLYQATHDRLYSRLFQS